MGAIWFRVRADLRARWRAWVALGVLVGIAGGVVMAATAGARRTSSAYPRFLETQRAVDVIADVRDASGHPVALDVVADFDVVADVAEAAALFVTDITTESGRRISFPDLFSITSSDGRFGSELNRSKIIEGRRPDPDSVEEVLVGFTVAERFGIAIGDELTMRMFEMGSHGPTDSVLATQTLRVTAIGAMPGEFLTLAGASIPSMHLTPAFLRRYDAIAMPDPAFAIRFRNGIADLPDFVADAETRGLRTQAFFQQHAQTASVRRSIGFQAMALALLAGLTALASLAILGQALGRQAWLEADEYPALRAIAMTPGQLMGIGALRSLFVAAVAALVACSMAIAASPLMPIGLARIAEPDPGLAIDGIVLGFGVVAMLALVTVSSAFVQWRASRAAALGRPAAAYRSPSRIVTAIARAGAPAPVVAGTRLALETGRGRTSVPVRSTIVGLAVGVIAATSAVTFSSSMNHLVASPALTGWTFDLLAGGPPEQIDALEQALKDDGVLVSRTVGAVTGLVVEGEAAYDGSLVLPPELSPAIAEGRAPEGPDEVALGRDTMRRFGLAIGDRARVQVPPRDSPSRALSFRIVGRLIQPSIGFNLGGAGEGATMSMEAYRRLAGSPQPGDVASFFRLTPDADIRAVVERMAPRFPATFISGRRESSASADVARLQGVPIALAAILCVMAAATVVHTLVTSVRRRARDLAILRTLGFVSRQIRTTVAWQATCLVAFGLLIGIPLGVAVGRWGWVTFADNLGVVPVTVVPVVAVLLAIPAALLGGNIVASVPGRAAARTEPAVVLRAE